MKGKTLSRKLLVITIVYWFLLLYVVAALVWWFISLQRQNEQATNYKLQELKKDEIAFEQKYGVIQEEERRKTTQYLGEGITFLALILISAVYIYRATRRQFRLSTQQQNFMMAITHELKTPIAVTLLNLETLQKHRLNEEKQQKLISNTIQEANRLNTLCTNILLASQLDSGAYTLYKVDLNFSELTKACLAGFHTRFPARVIVSHIVDDIYLSGEELLLQMLVNNLVENALKYTPKENEVNVELCADKHKVSLKVADQGYGIEDKEKAKVFDKFYRIGNESTRNAKGTGLGLYLCKRIVHDHGGEISVKDNKPGGSIFSVAFKQ